MRTIHVYDFDNTLFLSPLPNPKLWNPQTLGQLQMMEIFTNGGWWHDSRLLAATGEGVEKEEVRAWEGSWNENIVSLVELSMAQKDTLNILLTGRSVKGFSELIQRMVKAKKLEFDMICLKPEIGPEAEKIQNTKHFKTMLLSKVMDTYVHAESLKIYEDRVGHVQAFERFFEDYNERNARSGRKPLAAEVIQVAALTHTLDPVTEVAEVQKLINDHNTHVRREGGPGMSPLHIQKHVFFTGYLLSSTTTHKLLEHFPVPNDDDIRILASNIMITPRRAPQAILNKIGGLGNQVEFEVVGIGSWQDRVWAALVRPVDPKAKIHTDTPKPMIVLAHRRGAKPIDANMIKKWQDVEEGLRFIGKVEEKILLRIESEEETLRAETEWRRGHHQNHRHQYYNRTDGERGENQHHFHHHGGFRGGHDGPMDGHSGRHGHDGYHGGHGVAGGNERGGQGNGRGGRKRMLHGFDDRRGGGRGKRQWD